FDLRQVLEGARELRAAGDARVAALADRLLGVAHDEGDLLSFGAVARARFSRLGDPAGARAALEAGCRALAARETRGYEWALLAKGYGEVLGDPAGGRAALEAGREAARAQGDADDLASVGLAWAEMLDREGGVSLVREAERMAADEERGAWGLANAWSQLGDPAEVRRVLEAALGRAKTAEGALHVARAWASHEAPDEARRALGRAKALASEAGEWLEIGEVALDNEFGVELVREAVERAEALAKGPRDRARVSSAYATWLGDHAAAERVGPRGKRPEALRRPARRLEGWATSAAGLFDWLRARASSETLARIASADYGSDEPRHLATLRDICATGLLPRPLAWEPGEGLRLTRWGEGERVDHLGRALCCAILCVVDDQSGVETNGPILADSCLALARDEATREALPLGLEFFAWLCETDEIFGEADEGPDGDEAGERPESDEADEGPGGVDAGERPEGDEAGDDAPAADALLLLLLLGLAVDPSDARLVDLAGALLTHPHCPPEALREIIEGATPSELWRRLIDGYLGAPAVTHPTLRALRARLARGP
ncbi:MAG TPA: hypothetical protein VFS00_33350, partial [Polyangiaceae bacterium]|nr:hypothetical protein [Polyangiaceae bacterium]